MKIAVLADLHDNWRAWEIILPILQKEPVDLMIFCGDMCSPAMMKKLAEDFKKPVHFVYGNIDGDYQGMEELTKILPNLTIRGQQGELEINNKKIAFVHYPEEAKQLAKGQQYDYVFYGHVLYRD